MWRALLVCPVFATLVISTPARAAFLRPATQLASAFVRLSDLFTDAGPQAALVLGPAPPPGEHIVVEAPQLDAIARQFGVSWRASSGAERAVLERPGLPLPREAVIASLRRALDGEDAPPGDVLLPGFDAPLVPPEAHAAVAVEQVAYEAGSGRFTAAIVVTGTDMEPQRLRLSGGVAAMLDLPVATRPLPAGTVLQAGDLRVARVRATAAARPDLAQSAAEAVGFALKRAIPPGLPIARGDLIHPVAVTRGATVAMQLAQAGILLTATGVALQSGAVGERIDVRNPASRAVVQAEITGPDTVRVAPGSLPRRPPDLNDAANSAAGPL